MFGGGSNDAGFVQVMQGRVKDQDEMRRRDKEMQPELRKMRPDIIGGVTAFHGDGGGFTSATYFTSEAEARNGEKEMGESDMFKEFMSMFEGELTFYDLTEPQFD